MDAEPAQAVSREAFLEALGRRRLLHGDTYKQLELRTGVPRSTLSDMLTRHRVPRREVVQRVIGVYAANGHEAGHWTDVWSELSLREGLPVHPATSEHPAEQPTTAPTPEPALPRPEARPRGASETSSPRRWLRWALPGALVAAAAGVVLVSHSGSGTARSGPAPSAVSGTPDGRPTAAHLSPAGYGSPVVPLRVYNVQADCRRPHTETCALRLSHDPRTAASVSNRAGEVWHGDAVLAACAITDGRTVTDENLSSSRVWYLVRVPATDQTGWLPGIRVRTAPHVRAC